MNSLSDAAVMDANELRAGLTHLVRTYVPEDDTAGFFALIGRDPIPAKGILADLGRYLDGKVALSDSSLVQDIAHYYC